MGSGDPQDAECAYLHRSLRRGRRNIPKILENDKVKVPLVSYDSPEEVREDVAKGSITAVVPANFFSQSYLATYIAANALLQGKPLPHGWVKVPTVTVDKSNTRPIKRLGEARDRLARLLQRADRCDAGQSPCDFAGSGFVHTPGEIKFW